MANASARPKGGRLLFLSSADYEAYLEEAVRAGIREKMREHIQSMPGLTPELAAQEWARLAIANAMVTAREGTK